MPPKAKAAGRRRSSVGKGLKVSTSKQAPGAISMGTLRSEPSSSLTSLGPESSPTWSPKDSSSNSPGPSPSNSPSRSRGKKKTMKLKKRNDEEEEPEAPRYKGPPPDEEFLDEVMAQINTRDAWKEPNWIEMLHMMLREGEEGIGQEVNTRNIHGFSPLAVASAAGDERLVSLMLHHRADVSLASTGRSELPLHHAANFRHRLVTQLLIGPCAEKGIIDARSVTGWTPLHTCARSGDREVFKILMRARADLETRNPITGNEHALHVAARADNIDIIEILLAADADVDCKDSLSRTPLHMAASMTNYDCIGLLLRSRADPHHRGGPNALTPLEMVPPTHSDAMLRERTINMLTSYSRAPPTPHRTDVRFDQRDPKSLI